MNMDVGTAVTRPCGCPLSTQAVLALSFVHCPTSFHVEIMAVCVTRLNAAFGGRLAYHR
jgi:hypothetical protein